MHLNSREIKMFPFLLIVKKFGTVVLCLVYLKTDFFARNLALHFSLCFCSDIVLFIFIY